MPSTFLILMSVIYISSTPKAIKPYYMIYAETIAYFPGLSNFGAAVSGNMAYHADPDPVREK